MVGKNTYLGVFWSVQIRIFAALGGRENLIFENRPNFLILQKPFSKSFQASGMKKPF